MLILKIKQNLLKKFQKTDNQLNSPENPEKINHTNSNDSKANGIQNKFQNFFYNIKNINQKLGEKLPNKFPGSKSQETQNLPKSTPNHQEKSSFLGKQISRIKLSFTKENGETLDNSVDKSPINQNLKFPKILENFKKPDSFQKGENLPNNKNRTTPKDQENQQKSTSFFRRQITKIKLPFTKKNLEKSNNNVKYPEILDQFSESRRLKKIEEKLDDQKLTKVKLIFEKFLNQVKPEDIEKINQNLEKMYRGRIKEIWPKIQGLAKMIRDPQSGWRSKALAIASLVYLISPFDAIPDVIPIAGLADDAALIIAVTSTLAYELEKYLIKQVENHAEIEIKKYNKIVRITLIGSIISAVLTIIVKYILNQL